MKKKNIKAEYLELLNDSFWLGYILKLIKYIDNQTMAEYLSEFLKFCSTIYSNELIVAEYGKISESSTMTKKNLKKMRMEYVKDIPHYNAEYVIKKVKEMGINFNEYVFDMNLICNPKKELFDTNFRLWNVYEDKEKNIEELQDIVNTPLSWTRRILEGDADELYKIIEQNSQAIIKTINEYKLKRYSYSSYILFNKSKLPENEKIYIIYRYGLIKTMIILDNIFSKNITVQYANIELNMKKFLDKIKAIIIEIIGNDRKYKYTVIEEVIELNSKTIDKDFYKLNRKLRDNIHYTKTTIIEDSTIKEIEKGQKVYFNNLIRIFDSKMIIKFGLWHKIGLSLAKISNWSNYEEYRKNKFMDDKK